MIEDREIRSVPTQQNGWYIYFLEMMVGGWICTDGNEVALNSTQEGRETVLIPRIDLLGVGSEEMAHRKVAIKGSPVQWGHIFSSTQINIRTS